MSGLRRRELRRILVALDAASQATSCIECAVELAASLRAELVGLFVEDDELLRMAALPTVRQFDPLTGLRGDFGLGDTERTLRTMAAAAERQLAEAAVRWRVSWSFRTVRGGLAREVATAADEVDLLVVPRASRPLSVVLGLETAARDASRRGRAALLTLPPGARVRGAILTPYDGTPEADEALDVAAEVAAHAGVAVELLVPAAAPAPAGGGAPHGERFGQLVARAHERVGQTGIVVRARPVRPDPSSLRDVLSREPGRTLVVGESREAQAAPGPGATATLPSSARRLAEDLDLVVLVVRPDG